MSLWGSRTLFMYLVSAILAESISRLKFYLPQRRWTTNWIWIWNPETDTQRLEPTWPGRPPDRSI